MMANRKPRTHEKAASPNPNRPMFIVGATISFIFVVIFAAPLIARYFQPRLNTNISFETDEEGRTSTDEPTSKRAAASFGFDLEVPVTETRLREISLLAIASHAAILNCLAKGERLTSVENLIASIDTRPLESVGITRATGALAFLSEHNEMHLRFDVSRNGVEVFSLPRTRRGGPQLLLRLPEIDGYNAPPGRLRYFEAIRIENVRVPPPFAVAAEIEAGGWRSSVFDARTPDGSSIEDLNRWAINQAATIGATNSAVTGDSRK